MCSYAKKQSRCIFDDNLDIVLHIDAQKTVFCVLIRIISSDTYIVGAPLNHLDLAILMSTHNIDNRN